MYFQFKYKAIHYTFKIKILILRFVLQFSSQVACNYKLEWFSVVSRYGYDLILRCDIVPLKKKASKIINVDLKCG